MKPCTKTDFRMYSPLVGPAEEICWTCGVAKEKHGLSGSLEKSTDLHNSGITSGVALAMLDQATAPVVQGGAITQVRIHPQDTISYTVNSAIMYHYNSTGKFPTLIYLNPKRYLELSNLPGIVKGNASLSYPGPTSYISVTPDSNLHEWLLRCW